MLPPGPEIDSLPPAHFGGDFQAQGVQPDEAGRVILVVGPGRVAQTFASACITQRVDKNLAQSCSTPGEPGKWKQN